MKHQSLYALANPVSLIVDKEREAFTRQDFIQVIEEKRIEKIGFHYVGLDCKLKELRIPITNRFRAEQVLTDGERVDGSSLFKGIVDAAVSDLYVVPLYKTAFINPFDEHSLDFICRYFLPDGRMAPFSPDTILHQASGFFTEQTGFDLHALGELEFFLFFRPENSHYNVPSQRGYQASSPFIKTWPVLDEMVREISRITGAVKYAHSEVGNIDNVQSHMDEIRDKRAEQMEIEFLPTPIEDTADILAVSRWLIRNIAHKHGCVASFTPKIEEGVAGNGMHFHVALMKDGQNSMADENGLLSEAAKKLIGGLCTYADSLTAFGNTVSSAYFRLVPNQEAPTRICWGDLNRNTLVRVPLGWGQHKGIVLKINPQQKEPPLLSEIRQTVELRSPDGSALIHLLLAGMALAIERGLNDPAISDAVDRFYMTHNNLNDQRYLKRFPELPRSCVESSKALLKNRSLYEDSNIFPASIIDYVCHILQKEDDEKLNGYLSELPYKDRLLEGRKIMHKYLHQH